MKEEITASIGVSLFLRGESFDAMFAEADDALYRTKGNGKISMYLRTFHNIIF